MTGELEMSSKLQRSTPLRPTPAPLLGDVAAYSPPHHGAPIDLHLDGNEGQPPPARLLEVVVEAGPAALRSYPDASALERELASQVGVEPRRVLVTAGADDALERLLRASLAPGRELLLHIPTFGMIMRYARLAGGTIVTVPWEEGELPIAAMLDRVTARTAAIVVVSPNSPTGLAASAEDLRRLSRAAPGAVLIVDLAYSEFADEDLTACALSLPNAVITRTFSKAWGLAGLRVGWAAGAPEVLDWMRVVGHPYAVAAPSLAMALARLRGGREEMAAFVAEVCAERRRLAALLEELGASSLPSQANFLLARFRDALWVRDGLAGLGIGVRLFPGKPELEGRLRITVPGDEEELERLCRGLRCVMRPRRVILGAGARSLPGDLDALSRAGFAVAELDEVAGWGHGEESWLVTSRVDEIEVARRAGVLPLGCDAARAEELVGVGAARVVRSVAEILEVLP
jgi:histidinol-phosphate aminotransferase